MPENRYSIGIDPGITGAIAFLDGEICIDVWDMPISRKLRGKGNEVNAFLLADILREAEGGVAYVEAVSAMPGQGVS